MPHGDQRQSLGGLHDEWQRFVSVKEPWQGSPPHLFASATVLVLEQRPEHFVSCAQSDHMLNWHGEGPLAHIVASALGHATSGHLPIWLCSPRHASEHVLTPWQFIEHRTAHNAAAPEGDACPEHLTASTTNAAACRPQRAAEKYGNRTRAPGTPCRAGQRAGRDSPAAMVLA